VVGLPTATGNTVTTSSFSMAASLRSGMLTTTRRRGAFGTVGDGLSAAKSGWLTNVEMMIAAAAMTFPVVRSVPMSPSVTGTTGATAEPPLKRLNRWMLLNYEGRRSVSAGARRVPADTDEDLLADLLAFWDLELLEMRHDILSRRSGFHRL